MVDIRINYNNGFQPLWQSSSLLECQILYKQKGYHAFVLSVNGRFSIFETRTVESNNEFDSSLAFIDTDFDFFEYECMRCGYLIDHKQAQRIKKDHHFTVNFEEEPEEEMFGVH